MLHRVKQVGGYAVTFINLYSWLSQYGSGRLAAVVHDHAGVQLELCTCVCGWPTTVQMVSDIHMTAKDSGVLLKMPFTNVKKHIYNKRYVYVQGQLRIVFVIQKHAIIKFPTSCIRM